MANIGEQAKIKWSDLKYNTGIGWNDEIKMTEGGWEFKMGVEIAGTIIAVLLLFVAIVMMAQLTSKLNDALVFGNRSQKMCGQNYMEYESARNKLYTEYNSTETEKKIKSIKQLLSGSLILIAIALIVSLIITFYGRNTTLDWDRWYIILYFRGFAILLGIFLLIFFAVNRKAVLENTYGDSKTEKAMTPLLIVMLVLIVLICICNIVFINPVINDQTANMFVLMIVTILTITFMFIINIRTKEINDKFISKYKSYLDKINDKICILKKDKTNTIPEGVNKGMTIHKWIIQLLSRNYERISQSEGENNIPIQTEDEVDCNNKKNKINYAYLEHNHGKELDELPDDKVQVLNSRDTIRENLWNMRNENSTMIKPVKQFVQQMRTFVLVALFMIMFMVYHVAYINYPGYTKLALVAIVLLFTLVLMYSVIV